MPSISLNRQQLPDGCSLHRRHDWKHGLHGYSQAG